MAQVVEFLSCKYKVLSLNPSTTKKKKKKLDERIASLPNFS
jgi:hypothetical protein